MRVLVLNKGFFGGEIRELGSVFDVPDEIMADEKLRPSWVEPVDGPDLDADDDEDGESAKETKPRGKPGRKPKRPAADEPKGNGVAEALGSPPDWLPPGGADALKGDDE